MNLFQRGRCALAFVCLGVSWPVATLAGQQVLGTAARRPVDERVRADLPMLHPSDSAYALIPIKLGTRDSLWFIVDIGASMQAAVWPRTLALPGAGVQAGGAQIDSIRFGDIVRSNVDVTEVDLPTLFRWNTAKAREFLPPYRQPDGILGVGLLQDANGRMYDLEFDFPAGRFRVYDYTKRPKQIDSTAKPTWAGVRGLVCTPMVTDEGFVFVNVTLNGHDRPVRSLLDTGAPRTMLATAIAAQAGITPQSPGVTVKDTSVGNVGSAPMPTYRVPAMQITMQGIPLSPSVVYLKEKQPMGVLLGLSALSDRVLFVAYSTNEVCLGPVGSKR